MNFNKNLVNVLFALSTIQGCILLYYMISVLPQGAADEIHFINALDKVKTEGWWSAVSFGVSIPHILVNLPLSFVLPSYLSYRITNLLIVGLLFLYISKLPIQNKKLTYSVVLAYFATTGFVLQGTNDALLHLSLAIFFIETYFFVEHKKMNYPILAFSLLVVSLYTREMIAFYLPVIFISVYHLRKMKLTFKLLRLPIMLTALFLILNIPSLYTNKKLSYDNKSPLAGYYWPQIGYLSTIETNAGIRKEGDHPNWGDVKEYIAKHGENSLPKTYTESVFFDIKLTLSEFIENLLVAVKGCFRQMGFILFIPLLLLIPIFNKQQTPSVYYLIPTFWLPLLAFSFVVIAIVELRWMGASALLTIITGFHLLQKRFSLFTSSNNNMIMANRGLIISYILLSTYGIFTLGSLMLSKM